MGEIREGQEKQQGGGWEGNRRVGREIRFTADERKGVMEVYDECDPEYGVGVRRNFSD